MPSRSASDHIEDFVSRRAPDLGARDEIRRAIEQRPVVIVWGETARARRTSYPRSASRRTTAAPASSATRSRDASPRPVATRIAEELKTPFGEFVGHKLRFQDRTSPRSVIELMTDGILLAETQGDRHLRRHDTITVDEAHERSLTIGFLLGYLTWLLPKRPDLKVIITSATIGPGRFSKRRPLGPCGRARRPDGPARAIQLPRGLGRLGRG